MLPSGFRRLAAAAPPAPEVAARLLPMARAFSAIEAAAAEALRDALRVLILRYFSFSSPFVVPRARGSGPRRVALAASAGAEGPDGAAAWRCGLRLAACVSSVRP